MATQGLPADDSVAPAAVVVGPALVLVLELVTFLALDPSRVTRTMATITAATATAAPPITAMRRRAAFFLAASAAAILASRPVRFRLRLAPAIGES
jgi:hypothetical protein